MNTQLHSDDQNQVPARRPLRCLRHRVWMAACEDCRTAHIARLATRPAVTAPRHTGPDDAGH